MIRIDPIQTTTSFLKRFCTNKPQGSATGFFFKYEGNIYFITNKHVIYGDKYSIAEARPEIDEIRLFLHRDPNDLRNNEDFILSLTNTDQSKKWKEHNDPKVDIVAIEVEQNVKEKYFFVEIDEGAFAPDNVEVRSEKIFIMGYPHAWFDNVNNLPITRIGHLSSPFMVPFRGAPYMLGDIETHPGMSGSPVFMEIKDFVTRDSEGRRTTHMGTISRFLIGVFSGQPIIGENISHSLSVIWFPQLIKEIINKNK